MIQKIKNFLDMIKFEHTIFALPFAYLGMMLAAEGWPTAHQFIWITVAMAAARTVAMAINRLADRRIDADNPRTARRPLVAGAIAPPPRGSAPAWPQSRSPWRRGNSVRCR